MTAVHRNRRQGVPLRRPLLPLALAVGAGIVANRCVGLELNVWWCGAGGACLLGFLLQRQRKFQASIPLLLVAMACLGGSWHQLRWHYFDQDHLAQYADEVPAPVCVRAVALDRIQHHATPAPNPLRAIPAEKSSELQVRITQVRDGREWRTATGQCQLWVRGELRSISAGDQLLIFASLGKNAPALNPGEYDWSRADRGAGRHCQLFCRATQCVSVTRAVSGWSLGSWLPRISQRCADLLSTYVRPQQRDLAQAILLGARQQLTADDRDTFLKTGTIHLLVVSGMHVGLLAAAIWMVVGSGFISRQNGLLLTACLVIGYALIAGGQPPVIRATVLVVTTLASFALGRRVSPSNLLAAAALVVLAINPSELFRAGTQLSFLCVATLAAYAHLFHRNRPIDPLTRLIRETRPWHQKAWHTAARNFGHTAFASLAVWLIAAPLVAHQFHITAPISILITPLLWPLVAMALVSGMAICYVGWLLPPLAWCLGELCSFGLWATKSIVAFTHELEAGSFYLAGPPEWWLVAFYLGLLIVALRSWSHFSWNRYLSVAALWVAVGFVATGAKVPDEKLRCTFLAVGHGTCVVLELPGGETMLYDAGSLGSPERASQTIASFLWSRGLTHLDAIVLSHADVDHYNAVPGLLERFDVAKVYVSPLMFDPWINDGFLDAPEFLRETLTDAGVPLQTLWINDRLTTSRDDLVIEVLHPPRRGVAGKDNANSLLLAIQYAGHSILLPGDLESPGIEAVTAERPQHFDIVMAPHHGSARSDPPGFAAWCTPNYVVVSGPRVSPAQQFTAESYQAVGAEVMHTANVGAVEFVLEQSRVKCSSFVEATPK